MVPYYLLMMAPTEKGYSKKVTARPRVPCYLAVKRVASSNFEASYMIRKVRVQDALPQKYIGCLQGCTKRLFPGCVKLNEPRWELSTLNNAANLPHLTPEP